MEEHNDDGDMSRRNDVDQETIFPKDSMDISDQIGRALESFSPFLFKKLNETLEGAMNDHIAGMIREEVAVAVREEVAIAVQAEFIKRDSMGKDDEGGEKEVETGAMPFKHKFSYKDFSICKPIYGVSG